MTWHKWWGASQWAAYLEPLDPPVKQATKWALDELLANRGDLLAPKDLAGLMLEDPLFSLRLLKEANRRLPRHLARDITAPLGAVLALGTATYSQLLREAEVADENNAGFVVCEWRAVLAARIAHLFGSYHYDLDPDELALATLLANLAEIELWAFAPELPQAALDVLARGGAERSDQAQHQACGFDFRELTLLLCERWQLPTLIVQLIRGDQSLRARLARLAVDTARHLGNGPDDPALPHDVAEAAHLTGASLATVVQSLPILGSSEKAVLLAAAEACQGNAGNAPTGPR
ncbi:HDOD domain-containing protein [Parasulfuritortus cantonensis]|uniref:HDOD domain-containing protein n=1 Tax=Parasulfuritortus cantonensis TaxID=2528202 RepID=A0A4R1BE38_9PROT|nr:HDOD domain-containing protein [Parasulfuritortus cantonensis]TCJ15333.1 HDOD domain-containing protein [Parasulfuritortus cantonensis]